MEVVRRYWSTSNTRIDGRKSIGYISIWLSMAVKGMRDLHGHSANDAHLITLFHRICKLLYFGIKPVFIFDGKAPLLKQKTLHERRQRSYAHIKQSKNASEKLIQNYLKRKVVELAIGTKDGFSVDNNGVNSSKKKKGSAVSSTSIAELKPSHQESEDDLFKLPQQFPQPYLINSSDEEQEEQWKKRSTTRDAVYGSAMSGDFRQMMAIDINSDEFKSLPSDIQHELLNDIKEIRKRRRTQLEPMPKNTNTFSNYQLSGLLAKRVLDERIEKVEKRMQEDNALSMSSFGFDDEMYEMSSIKARNLLSDENTRFVLINGLKKISSKQSTNSDSTILMATSSVTSQVIAKEDDEIVSSNRASDEGNLQQHETSLMSTDTTDSSFMSESNVESTTDTEIPNKLFEVEDVKPKVNTFDAADATSSCSSNVVQKVSNEIFPTPGETIRDSIFTDNKIDSISPSEPRINNDTVVLKENTNEETGYANRLKQTEIESTYVNEAQKFTINFVKQDNSETSNITNKSVILSVGSDDESDFIEVAESNIEKVESSEKISDTQITVESDNSETPETENTKMWEGFNEEDFELLSEQLDAEDVALMEKMKSSSRAARNVSDVATTETQHLLQLFGIPYLVSPQEAESQCAYLDISGLTMGTITEDSDVWLFGGRVVFKDVFDRKREPCLYSLTDIKAELGLERSHFINIALCSGSDYTAGIEGVGPVTALEIMKEFPENGIKCLQTFRNWWNEAHKQVKSHVTETKIKSQLRKLNLPADFPSQIVADAYTRPMVNESKEIFSWGIPDLDGIRNFAIERLNWTKTKVDEILLPVLKRASERNAKKQTKLFDYFPKSVPSKRTSKKKSKRVLRAITGISQAACNVTSNEQSKRSGTKRRGKTSKSIPTKRNADNETALKLSESSSSESD